MTMTKFGNENATCKCCACGRPIVQGEGDDATCVECGGTAELQTAKE